MKQQKQIIQTPLLARIPLTVVMNGSVRRLQRRGQKNDGQYGKVDNLTLHYDAKWVSETFGYAVSFNVYVPVEKRYVPYNQYSKEIDFVEYYNTLDGLIIKNQ